MLQQEILFSFNVIELLQTDFGLQFSHNRRVSQKQTFRICLQYFWGFVLGLVFLVWCCCMFVGGFFVWLWVFFVVAVC